MSYEYEESLPVEARKRYKEKLVLIGLDECPYKLPEDNWLDDPTKWPSLTYHHLYHYLIKSPRVYTPEAMENYKSLEAFKFFRDGWVQSVKHIKTKGLTLLKADVRPSYRTTDTPHKPWVALGECGNVLFGHCNCMAGLGETCSHVAAVLYKIEAAVRIGLTSAAPTDLPCKWNQNFTKNIVGCPVAEISIYSDSAKSKVNKSKTSVQEKRASDDEILGFLNSIAEVAPNTVCLSLFSQFQKNFTSVSQPDPNALTMKLPDSLRSLYHCNNLLLASTEFDELVEASIEKVQELSEQQMLYVEEATRNQSRCFAWFQQRAGRITGSTFYEAAHTSTTNPSKSLVQKLCSENSIQLNVPSLSWGRDHESEVITLYQSAFSNANFSNSCIPLHNSTLHENLSVEQIGLCISKDKPWYAASPDAVVFCDCCSYGVLEVKCPYSLRDMSLKEEIHKNKFYIKVNDEGEYILNEKHKYYYQVQLEMFATDTEHCDFMVWTPKEFICVRVPINRTFLENTMKICDGFWRNIVLKELLLRTFESDKARLTSTSKVVNKLCKCGNDEGEMVGCDSCDNWYHPTCIGRKTLPTSKTWYCKDCKKRKAK